MAVAFDAVGPGVRVTGTSTASWSHTTTGSDTIGIVHVATGGGASALSTATWGGVPMSPMILPSFGNTGVFILFNPPTGTQTVAVGSGTLYRANSITYTGVGGIADWQNTTGTTSTSTTVTSATGELALFLANFYRSIGSAAFSALNGTSRWNSNAPANNESAYFMMEKAGAASVTGTSTCASGTFSSSVGLTLIPKGAIKTGVVASGNAALGTRATGSSTTLGVSWTQQLTNSDVNTVVIVGVNMSISSNTTGTTCSVTYGGVAMTQLGLVEVGSSTNRAAIGLYSLFNPPTGNSTISVTTGVTTKASVMGQSVAYYPVISLDNFAAAATTGITVTSAVNSMAIAASTNGVQITPGRTFIRAFIGAAVSGIGDFFSMQDAIGAASVVFTNTGTATTPESMGVSITPGITPANTDDFFVMF